MAEMNELNVFNMASQSIHAYSNNTFATPAIPAAYAQLHFCFHAGLVFLSTRSTFAPGPPS